MRGVFGILWQIIVLDPMSETLVARELSPVPMVAEGDPRVQNNAERAIDRGGSSEGQPASHGSGQCGVAKGVPFSAAAIFERAVLSSSHDTRSCDKIGLPL